MVWNSETGLVKELTKNFDYNATNVIWDGSEALWFLAPMEATHQALPRGHERQRFRTDPGRSRHQRRIDRKRQGRSRYLHDLFALRLYEIDLKDGAITHHVHQPADPRQDPPWQSRETLGGNHRRQTDADVGNPAARFRSCEEIPDAALLRRRSAKRRIAILELPLELPGSWPPTATSSLPQPPGRAFVRTGVARPDLGRLLGPEYPRLPSAIDYVAKEPWVDKDRLGCVGASYGGYSVYFLAGHHDGRFKAFISHCGIFDFEAMYGSTEENFLPEQRLRRPLLGQAERDGHAYLC